MKINNLAELNGSYSIVYQTEAPELDFVWFDHTTASATLLDGAFFANDAGGATWDAAFQLLANGEVGFVANVNTDNAPIDTFILDKNGRPTRISQQYSGSLKPIVFEGDIFLTGTVIHGVVEITVQLKRMIYEL